MIWAERCGIVDKAAFFCKDVGKRECLIVYKDI